MHQVGDPVYSNSFGLGYISKIEDRLVVEIAGIARMYDSPKRYYVRWMDDAAGQYADNRHYPDKGIDTLKMFLRMKLRGENI